MSTVDSSSLIGGDMVQSYSVDFGDIFAISALKIAQPAVPLLLDLPVVLASLPSCTDAQTLMQRSESFLLWDRGRNNNYNVTCNLQPVPGITGRPPIFRSCVSVQSYLHR